MSLITRNRALYT